MVTETEILIPHRFDPRPYQIPLLRDLDNGIKKHVWCLHRGAGKDLLALNYLIKTAIQKRGVYLHCFPNYAQGKKAIWKSNHNTDDGDSLAYLDHIPPELIKSKNSSDMTIEFVNGSVYMVVGLDGKNANRVRGMNPTFVILSEYAYMDPESWYTIEPRLTQNKGIVIFASTPNGQNHFYTLLNNARRKPDEYAVHVLTIDDTSVYDHHFIQNKREVDEIPEDFIQQEYFCSFTRGAEGSYYGKQIQKARDEERITNLNPQTDLPCHTAWDIGIGDSTAIWIFQEQKNGNLAILHYYENNGEGLEHYIRYLSKWQSEKEIIWGNHYVPHDMQNREFTSGVDRLRTAKELGIEMQVVPKKGIEEGIQAVRSLLGKCAFDSKGCARGIKCLDLYRKKWNESLKVYYDEPLHDQYSHGADAFRMLAIGFKAIGGKEKISGETLKDLNRKHYGFSY